MDRYRVGAVGLALLAGTVVAITAFELFPYHSLNHDEAVYLQQAEMLINGHLRLRPPVPDAMRPWFFVSDGSTLYPKYSPVPAGVFAISQMVLGTPRMALVGVAILSILMTYGLVETVLDPRHGLVAAAVLATSPLFLIDSSVFLPYAVTFALELGFALAYVRAVRTGRPAYGAVAGGAIGLAFFARPYTAVLFALPFIVHAGWHLGKGSDRWTLAGAIGPTAIIGLGFVALTLAYNALLTGNPLRFPYEAFAPRDGIGFGRRAILGYERVYTPTLAVRATLENLSVYIGRWIAAGPFGFVIGVVGLYRLRDLRLWTKLECDPNPFPLVIAGIIPAVVIGEAYFWGTVNVLGDLAVGGDGLIASLGPYYHFDLLLPTAMFIALGGLYIWDRFRSGVKDRFPEHGSAVTIGTIVLVASATVVITAGIAAPAVGRNARVTDAYGAAYEPVIDREFDDAVVLLPTPYGDWLNHPFQVLRNDPSFSGDVVFAIRGQSTWDLVDRYPDRSFYRYGYQGNWFPLDGSVTPVLQWTDIASGDGLALAIRFGVPDEVDRVSARVSNGDAVAYYSLGSPTKSTGFRLQLDPGNASLSGSDLRVISGDPLPVSGTRTIDIEIFLTTGASGFSYELAVPIRSTGSQVEAMTPSLQVCREPRLCDGEAAYVPGTHREDVWIETTFSGT